jgi:hypothetical protein
MRIVVRCLGVVVCVVVLLGVVVSVAGAAGSAAGFAVESFASPTVFSGGDDGVCVAAIAAKGEEPACDAYEVYVTNVGSAGTGRYAVGQPKEGEAIPTTITDTVPAGLVVQRIALTWEGAGAKVVASEQGVSPGNDLVPQFEQKGIVLCSVVAVSCTLPFQVAPDDRLQMIVYVTVSDASERPLANAVAVSGGGAPAVQTETPNNVGSLPAGFGVSNFGFSSVGLDGGVDRQAGGHPYALTVTIGLNNRFREAPDRSAGEVVKTSSQDVKDVVVDLPLGFVGSILAAPRCTLAQLSSELRCPQNTVVGHVVTVPVSAASIDSPVWNLTPERGFPAEFGYVDLLKASHVLYTHVVATPHGYVLQTTSPDVPQVTLGYIQATFYGDPARRDAPVNPVTGQPEVAGTEVPFFTNPTICTAASMTATLHVDSWLHPGRVHGDGTPDLSDPAWVSKDSVAPPPVGCNVLGFSPELSTQPTTQAADTPSGMDLELKIAQNEVFGTNATPPLMNASVTFPQGMSLDPSAADGLAACSEAQIGWDEAAAGPVKFDQAPPACPEASKVGSLELESPLVPGVLSGEMYLARQNENPFHSVFGLYVVVQDPVTGVLVKIAGHVVTNRDTGQITGVFDENPQLPFSDLRLHFFGGPRAVFATPEACGVFTTTSDFAPWSAPDSGPDATPFSSFPISTGCVSGFAPSFNALSTNVQAGAYTPFVASFSRADTDQELGGLSVSLPPGLLAKVAGVALCPDAQASAGTCPEASQVGTVRAGAGPGPNPLFVTGKAYLTGPYNGGPYGLSVVVPAVAGPFDFGNVVVRQSLRIDPNDAHVTDVSDPFPTILRPTGANGETVGIPIRLRRVDVSIDRAGFTFNPTNCSKLQVAASITSTQGATSALAVPFQVTNCAALKFTPKFSVSTSGRTSKANGASLTAHVSYPNLPQGSEANIASVKVSLPKQLPSRLTTLQKACLAATFNANPASCPAHSIIGHASVTTPLLPLPLSGPAYFVSHGGEAFPSLTIVLQGNGVTVQLVGATFINKQGITSTTFKTLPDVPFNTFQLTLPQGPFSALAANGNLCRTKLVMPTIFHAQNGLETHQNTPITTTNCPKHKHTPHHKHHKHHKHH